MSSANSNVKVWVNLSFAHPSYFEVQCGFLDSQTEQEDTYPVINLFPFDRRYANKFLYDSVSLLCAFNSDGADRAFAEIVYSRLMVVVALRCLDCSAHYSMLGSHQRMTTQWPAVQRRQRAMPGSPSMEAYGKKMEMEPNIWFFLLFFIFILL